MKTRVYDRGRLHTPEAWARDPDLGPLFPHFRAWEWAALSAAVAIGIVLVSVFGYAAIEHAIHPDCASVLACVRL